MRADMLRLCLALIFAAACAFVVFARWPGIDLWVTGLFFDPALAFARADTGLPNQLRLILWHLSEALLCAAAVAIIVGLSTGQDVLAVPRRVWAYVVLLYALAPGVLVDAVVKPLWGRARPADVIQFGGNLHFTPPQVIAHECMRNCSFVAGEMAGAVTLAVALAVILPIWLPRPSRGGRLALMVIVGIPILAGLQRIAAGRHFLSDVIFATIFVLLVAATLHAAMFRARDN